MRIQVTQGRRRVFRMALLAAGLAGVVVLLMLWLTGAFTRKVGQEFSPPPPLRPASEVNLVKARLISLPVVEPAVGTIRPVLESAVASKIMEKVVAVDIKAGQQVQRGQVLVRLDDTALKSRVQQAAAGVSSAQANRDQALARYNEIRSAYDKKVATETELSEAHNHLKGSEGDLQHAKDALGEARIVLGYATITSPMTGTVIDKKVNEGDMVSPGQVLLTLYDPTRMQLIASVRESLAQRLGVGNPIDVHIDTLNKSCRGTISEIVPEAQTASRTFQVKVTGPCAPGIYTGMFGRLLIPLDREQLLVVPSSAVRHVGQLAEVDVNEGGFLHRRTVQLGRTLDGGQVQVLSGLTEGEQVASGERDHGR